MSSISITDENGRDVLADAAFPDGSEWIASKYQGSGQIRDVPGLPSVVDGFAETPLRILKPEEISHDTSGWEHFLDEETAEGKEP